MTFGLMIKGKPMRIAVISLWCWLAGTAFAQEPVPLPADFRLVASDRIVCVGDSITHEGTQSPDGFVNLLQRALTQAKPELAIEVRGFGVPGYKTTNYLGRGAEVVLYQQPSVIACDSTSAMTCPRFWPITRSSPARCPTWSRTHLCTLQPTPR